MVVVRKRLIFWLIKAYIKKSGKIIALSFFLSLIVFLALLFGSSHFLKFLPVEKKTSIGLIGAYTQDDLPPIVLEKLSRGLTSVEPDGSIQPDLATSWVEKDNGKTYEFTLKNNIYFNNGEKFTSDKIFYNFSDVTVEKPNESKIIYKLKDAYIPFLVTVSKPIFTNGFTGVNDYRISDIKRNGNFVQSLTLSSTKNRFDQIRFQFYPSEDAVKMAFLLGEVSQANGISNPTFKDTSFTTFKNTNVTKKTNYSRLVTMFYNNADSVLSDKKFRLALTYALPKNYPQGQKTYMPYLPHSIYYNHEAEERVQDYSHAKVLLDATNTASGSGEKKLPTLTIKTLKKYRATANEIANSWKNVGINTQIEEVERIPSNFQIYLGEFNLPQDPDQYALWHSSQQTNITKYKNLRIDKLLEDGRKTTDLEERKRLYNDFQKYLMEDAPASFLYFPYEYELVRK